MPLTGKLKWYFRAVASRSVGLRSAAAQPTLVDIVKDGQKNPGVDSGLKVDGLDFHFWIEGRGQPVFGVEERPVPKGDVSGEWYSPTQPFPLKPPPLARMTWNPNEISKFTPEHQKYCEELFKNAQNDGPYAPVRMTDTVVFPGPDGGFELGAAAATIPSYGYYFTQLSRPGRRSKDGAAASSGEGTALTGKISGAGDASQMPFVRKNVGSIKDPATGWPCQSPPWGELFACASM